MRQTLILILRMFDLVSCQISIKRPLSLLYSRLNRAFGKTGRELVERDKSGAEVREGGSGGGENDSAVGEFLLLCFVVLCFRVFLFALENLPFYEMNRLP